MKVTIYNDYFMPAPRPRSFIEENRIRVSNPAKYEKFKRRIRRDINNNLDLFFRKKENNVGVELHFILNNKRKRDVDNLAKTILDSMNDLIYNDDNQVTKLVVTKKIDKSYQQEQLAIIVKERN